MNATSNITVVDTTTVCTGKFACSMDSTDLIQPILIDQKTILESLEDINAEIFSHK